MKLKSKPTPPKRYERIFILSRYVYSCDRGDHKVVPFHGSTVGEMLDWCAAAGLTPDQTTLEGGGYDEDEYLTGARPETEEEFAVRTAKYERELAAWNDWYAANKEAVDAEVATRKAKLIQKAAKEHAATEKRLERELAQLRKQTARAEKELEKL